MGFTKVLIAGSALFAAALAQGVSFTEWPTSVTAGQPTTLKWTGDGGAPVTLTLRKGSSTDLGDVEVISPDATNGEYTWIPSTDLENASDYAFQISQGDQINYSGLVSLGGGSDAPPPVSASAPSPQSDTAAATASGTTVVSAADITANQVDRQMTTSAPSTDSIPASVSASTSDAAAATTATSGPSATSVGSESSAQASETLTPSVVARPSLMNTPFNNAANEDSSETASASSSIQTGAAGRVTVPVAVGFVSAALMWCFH
ncbi:uncharacterized protein TRUGW13939_02259 [Talaromyces rugulosus]|uniref:Yeast cell wall synthesis Kre9/Knh1-like N-terminal domain-containing protein n=1 Tax=Talaromyces rugulosus TaxID=121627 RepID=A0A7H8QML1_TALRU|nr:uncharacterized protein TRUGW13939_02259 [Talaromyces rugulosus]QKX55167.1 hypothetical protein TRUGW13939_02259 [Talaromyces rugulosus]